MPGQFVPSPRNRRLRRGGSRVPRTGREESGPLSDPRQIAVRAMYNTPPRTSSAPSPIRNIFASQFIVATHNRTLIQAPGGTIRSGHRGACVQMIHEGKPTPDSRRSGLVGDLGQKIPKTSERLLKTTRLPAFQAETRVRFHSPLPFRTPDRPFAAAGGWLHAASAGLIAAK